MTRPKSTARSVRGAAPKGGPAPKAGGGVKGRSASKGGAAPKAARGSKGAIPRPKGSAGPRPSSGPKPAAGTRPSGRGPNEVVAGRHAVVEALRAGVRMERILIAPGSKPAPILDEIEHLARASHVPVEIADRPRLSAMAGPTVHQGVVAVARPFDYATPHTVLGTRSPRLVLIDGVTDPANLGSILRSADAFGFTGLLVPKHRSVSVTPAVRKVAAGAADRVPIALVASPADAVLRVRSHGVPVVGLDPEGPSSYRSLEPGGPICLVVGAEGRGLSRLVRERCDETVHIPMQGHLASINAAVATAVVMSWIADDSGV